MFFHTGEYLRKCRENAGLTQTELQKKLGYKGLNGLVSRVENGGALYPKLQFERLRKIVKIDDSDLIHAICQDYNEEAFTTLKPLLAKKTVKRKVSV